ncbi:MAG: hypothetical protein AAFZ38_01650 [Myxococcota bacterium]
MSASKAFSLVPVLLVVGGCSPSLRSLPARSGVQVDGQATEWDDTELTLLGESSLTVSLQHDKDNLFIYLATGDSRALGMLSQTGMTLWLNDTDDETEMIGVRFKPSPNLLVSSAPKQRTRDLHLERVGLWKPTKPEPVAHQGAVRGLWVAEIQLPLEPVREDNVRLAIEIVQSAKRSRSPTRASARAIPARRRRIRATPKVVHQPNVPSRSAEPAGETERIWFDVNGV